MERGRVGRGMGVKERGEKGESEQRLYHLHTYMRIRPRRGCCCRY